MRVRLAQITSGAVVGLSAAIYAVSYAALMFQGRLSAFIPYALTMTLITAAVGGLYGAFSEEPTLVAGPDANTTSILAAMLGSLAATPLAVTAPLHAAIGLVLAASLFTAISYLAIEHFHLARLVRFIPFQVMAGFLASTGWLMCSGALNMIAGTPLTLEGVAALVEQPWRPELVTGVALAAALSWLTRRVPAALAIPAFIVTASVAINAVVRGVCAGSAGCDPARWFYPAFDRLAWLPPWDLRLGPDFASELLRLAPSFFAVAFVGTLTVLLSLGGLELAYRRDFALERALRLHGRWTLLACALGGYIGLVSMGRSTMSRQAGGGSWSGWVIAATCLAFVLGFGGVVAWIPKAVLGALILHVGAQMLAQWLLRLGREIGRADLLQVLVILICVVAFGFVVGVMAGLLIACIVFVLEYGAMPFMRLDATLANVRSSVIRDVRDQDWLAEAGRGCRIGRFSDFVFFGVANSIYDWYRRAAGKGLTQLVLDFSHVRGIDQSALAVLQKIVRAEAAAGRSAILCVPAALRERFARACAGEPARLLADFDRCLEVAEEDALARQGGASGSRVDALRFLERPADREAFAAFLHARVLRPGEELFREGDTTDHVYFIDAGRAEVMKEGATGRRRLATVVAGAMIGEMASYSGEPRSATAVARSELRVRLLTSEGRARMRSERPDLSAAFDRHVILSLSATVKRANAAMTAATA